MSQSIRNRIKGHCRIRAGELVPHEFNFRLHPEGQRAALEVLYREVGFARSLLAFELPDGRLKLIDGHLRRELDPDMEVEVEVLDVAEHEARALLLSIDPLAALAQTQHQLRDRLQELAPVMSPELQAAAQASLTKAAATQKRPYDTIPEQYLVLVACRDEQHQVELLGRFQGEGLDCKALLSQSRPERAAVNNAQPVPVTRSTA
jgi:hypothetical protein